MRAAGPAGGGRQAKINQHVAKLNSGNVHKAQASARALKAMNPSWGELHTAHTAHPPHSPKPPAGFSPRGYRAQKIGKNVATHGGLGSDLGAVGHFIEHQAVSAATGNPEGSKIISTIASGHVPGVSAAKQDLQSATGYQQIEHIRQHPISGTVALAGILPFGKVGEVANIARGAEAGAKAERAAQIAADSSGLRKAIAGKRAERLAVKAGRRANSPEEAHNILQMEAEKATARATKAARKNPQFVEHLPGESRPETGGDVGRQVREAMRGVKKTYKQQQELQAAERAKRTAALDRAQKASSNFAELSRAKAALAGKLPTAPFKGFEPLRPLADQIKGHLDTLNMLPHDKNRLVTAIEKGLSGEVVNPSERKLIESVFGKEVKKLSPEAIAERGVGHTITDVGNIPRALMSSFDLSGAFRQNLAAIAHNPKLVFQGYHETLHGALSEAKFQELMKTDVHGDPYFHMAHEDGVATTEIGQNLNQKEEAIASNWAEHLHEIPGVRHTPLKYPLKAVSAGVRGSDRNYVLLLNRTRMRLYRVMVEQAAENGLRLDGPQGEKLRKEIADTVNTLTGRGSLGKTLTAHRATFNAVFFSPGLMKSRINLLNPLWYVKAEPFVRQQRLKTALRLYGTLATVLYAAKMAGAKVNTDPTNADFGKIRIGNTRIDVAGGLTQYMRLIGQLSEGKITSSTTGLVEPLSNGPFKTSRGNVIQQFARNKFAPIPGFAYDLAFGPGIGQKMNPKSVAGQMFVPLLMQDMWQISHAKGPGGGTGMAAETFLPDLFGVGVQNYGPTTPTASSGFSVGGKGGFQVGPKSKFSTGSSGGFSTGFGK